MADKKKVFLRLKFALEETEESGIIGQIATEMSEENASEVLSKQEHSALVCGPIKQMLDAYAVLNGYKRAYFIKAFPYVPEVKG